MFYKDEPRVVSGIQPSGTLHLGNYFGAIQQHIALQEEFSGQCYYFIADYHALTTLRNPDELRKHVFEVAVTYLACGLDPNKALLFRQSDIPEVTELMWLLSTVTGMGLLERATSYKEKVVKGIKPVAGLFFYPVLMAADILLYGASLVPVGKDQIPHLEMTRDMATRFNETFAKRVFRLPEHRLSQTPYVPGTDGHKMSKSYDNTIPLFLSPKELTKWLGQKIVTDSVELGQPLAQTRKIQIKTAEGDEEVEVAEPTLGLFGLFDDPAPLREAYRTGRQEGLPFGWGHAKGLLAGKIVEHFTKARARRDYFFAHPDEVEAVLQRSAVQARKVAQATLLDCKQACGLL